MLNSDIINDESIDIAVVKGDWGGGGADMVTKQIREALNADLFYGFKTTDRSDIDEINAVKVFKHKYLSSSETYRYFKYFWDGAKINELYDYDVIVQSNNQLSWFVPKDDQTIVRYCHTTPRLPYDMHYKTDGFFSKLQSVFIRSLFPQTTSYATRWICNSDLVKKRLQKYLSVDESDVSVVYPPVDTEKWNVKEKTEDDLYVTWSRIVESKRVDRIVEAFQGRDERLIVMGDGAQLSKIEKMASDYDNIEVWGYTDEDDLIETVSRAKCTIYNPINEDFGLVPIESAAAGTPCLSVEDGFSKYQIQEGMNGYLHKGTVDEIQSAVEKFESNGIKYSESELKKWSRQFDKTQFDRKVVEEVSRAWKEDSIETNIKW